MLLREADRHLGLLEAASRVLHDPRDSGKVVHSQLSLLRQRVYGLCLGYEDLNDHQELRRDPAIQTAVERSEVLASQDPAGWNGWTARSGALAGCQNSSSLLTGNHPASWLDFDATDDPVHGNQEGRFQVTTRCFLPLYVFCGGVLTRMAPDSQQLAIRDSGFCRHMLAWCETTWWESNARLLAKVEPLPSVPRRWARKCFNPSVMPRHRAPGDRQDRHTDQGANPRFIVTNFHEALAAPRSWKRRGAGEPISIF